jgi:hypothetical protein
MRRRPPRPGPAILLAALACPLLACSRREAPADPQPSPPVASAVTRVPEPAPSAPVAASPRDAATVVPLDLSADLAARTRDAKTRFGPRTPTRVLGDVFLLVGASPSTPLFDPAAALIERALPPLFDGRFTRHPDAAVTVLFFSSQPAFVAYARAHYGDLSDDDLGGYQRGPREIAVDGSRGASYLPSLTHEIVHPIVQADFPGAPLWFDEAIASLFEAPLFTKDGGIHGERRNWRHDYLLAALATPAERDTVRLDALVGMAGLDFKAWSHETRTIDSHVNAVHYAMARAVAAWLDDQGKLWPFYREWRDGFANDPTGGKSFATVMGMTPREANAAWLKWVR